MWYAKNIPFKNCLYSGRVLVLYWLMFYKFEIYFFNKDIFGIDEGCEDSSKGGR